MKETLPHLEKLLQSPRPPTKLYLFNQMLQLAEELHGFGFGFEYGTRCPFFELF